MNMNYAKFRNTLKDLRHCADSIADDEDLSKEEAKARTDLINLCRDIVDHAREELTQNSENEFDLDLTDHDD